MRLLILFTVFLLDKFFLSTILLVIGFIFFADDRSSIVDFLFLPILLDLHSALSKVSLQMIFSLWDDANSSLTTLISIMSDFSISSFRLLFASSIVLFGNDNLLLNFNSSFWNDFSFVSRYWIDFLPSLINSLVVLYLFANSSESLLPPFIIHLSSISLCSLPLQSSLA